MKKFLALVLTVVMALLLQLAVIQEQRKHRHLHQVTVRQPLSQQQQNLQVRQQRRLAKV